MMRSLLSILCLSFLAISCTIQQHVHFNKDWSGTMEYNIDMAGMIEIMKMGEDSTYSMDLMNDPETLAALEEIKSIEGISNVKFSQSEEGIVKYSYSFTSIDALNRSLKSGILTDLGGDKNSKPAAFSLKGNKLTYQFASTAPDSAEDQEEMVGMDLMNYELTISFDRKIKKLQSNIGAEIISNNSMEFKTDIAELSKLTQKPQTIVIQLSK